MNTNLTSEIRIFPVDSVAHLVGRTDVGNVVPKSLSLNPYVYITGTSVIITSNRYVICQTKITFDHDPCSKTIQSGIYSVYIGD